MDSLAMLPRVCTIGAVWIAMCVLSALPVQSFVGVPALHPDLSSRVAQSRCVRIAKLKTGTGSSCTSSCSGHVLAQFVCDVCVTCVVK